MSVITVQIGQCGNQIGEKFFDTLISDCLDHRPNRNQINLSYFNKINQDYTLECTERFFCQNEAGQLFARGILVDMESKVVNKILDNNKRYVFRAENSYTQKKGSGNNWSYGYCVNAPKSLSAIEEIVRKESERCDRLSSFLVCMSMAGGTGSGVGSFYTEFLRDAYPRTTLVNTCVWPFSTGEVTLQNYNFLLTLNKLHETSDGLILLENDTLHQISKRINSINANKEITFDDLNMVIGHKLASIMQPCLGSSLQKNYLNEVIGELCPHPDYKLLSLNNVPMMSAQSIEFSSFKWNSLYKNARQLLYTGGFMDEGLKWGVEKSFNKTISLALFARGVNDSDYEHSDLKNGFFDAEYLKKHFKTRAFGIMAEPVRLWQHTRPFNKYEKSLSMLGNSQMPAFKIDTLIDKAWRMFMSKAYVHQYVRYKGFDEENLLNAFIFNEQLVKNYMSL
ncbi:tubulin delta chain isoform X1 [Brachionus plicatilis]|uniref:Tubulin delta chain n=1 Tax=Brachionus plicatilis TaxID=10195 RepID=A0A3M7PAW0_BRAPC|nr:tubulin delta chain isoform X1 [Brachionus plicatilis]